MKKNLLLTLVITFTCGMVYSQNMIRVNNNPDFDADYTTLQDANDNASNGDTIYVEGSVTNYAGADISHSVTIIGPGFFLSENPATQANGLEAKFNGNINFNTGSDGSIITGCNFSSYYINIYVDDITVSRCKAYYIRFVGSSDNILVLQNYVSYSIRTYSSGVIT